MFEIYFKFGLVLWIFCLRKTNTLTVLIRIGLFDVAACNRTRGSKDGDCVGDVVEDDGMGETVLIDVGLTGLAVTEPPATVGVVLLSLSLLVLLPPLWLSGVVRAGRAVVVDVPLLLSLELLSLLLLLLVVCVIFTVLLLGMGVGGGRYEAVWGSF